jgi:adenylate kinase family enzyme
MKLIIIFGPQAVGKMTVGQEIQKQTNLKLFHNHMTIDLVSNFFSYGSKEGKSLVKLFRRKIFETVAKSNLEGLIFTYVWAFDVKKDWDYIEKLCDIFRKNNADIYFIELETNIQNRLERNKTPNRLEHKPTKRNTEWTEKDIIETSNKYRLNSYPGELTYKNYMRIDNSDKSAFVVANEIIDRFELQRKD